MNKSVEYRVKDNNTIDIISSPRRDGNLDPLKLNQKQQLQTLGHKRGTGASYLQSTNQQIRQNAAHLSGPSMNGKPSDMNIQDHYKAPDHSDGEGNRQNQFKSKAVIKKPLLSKDEIKRHLN